MTSGDEVAPVRPSPPDPPFTLLGDADAGLCADGVCVVPQPDDEPTA